MLFFISRSPTDSGPLLSWRVAFFGVGGILAVLGMGLEIRWLVNVAIGVLSLGFLLRFAGGERGSEEGEDSGIE